MKRYGVYFAGVLAFFILTAQNCKKREPLVDKASINNPKVFGYTYGEIYITLRDKSTGLLIEKGTPIHMALSRDSVRTQKWWTTRNSTDSDQVFSNLQVGNVYYFHSDYNWQGVNYVADTSYASNVPDFPVRGFLEGVVK